MASNPASPYPFWSQVFAGPSTFNEAFFSSNPDTRSGRRWGDFRARILRYEVFWAFFEQNVFRCLHSWAQTLKEDFALYPAVRTIYSPAYRIGEFWSEHLYGGILDYDAGDGVGRASSIPIVTDNESLRPVLAQIWRDSNWQQGKDVWTRYGAVLGDTGLMVCDDPDRRTVTLKPVHPRIVREADRDAKGNCKGYLFEERRPDPRYPDPFAFPGEVSYSETCEKVGGRVGFATYLDYEPFDWRDYPSPAAPRVGPAWTEDYGFVPFVLTQHRDMGFGWGWSELQASLSKLMELDELASNLNDQVRKTVRAPWLMAGVRKGEVNGPALQGPYDDAAAAGREEPEKDELPYLYVNEINARAQALVAPLDIKAVSDHVLTILRELERDHPELQADMANSAGDASGRALRVARERTESRVVSRRAAYDDALVRAQMMAVSIGAQKGYPGFEAFDAGSYERGDLAHSIGDRPVFAVDTMDHLEEVQARANALVALVKNAGMPIEVAMEQAGYGDEVIERVVAAQEKAKAEALKAANDLMRSKQALMPGRGADPATPGAPGGPLDPGSIPRAEPGQPAAGYGGGGVVNVNP